MAPDSFPAADGDVSVVIVAYHAREALAECLESFERHRPARVREVIVIDNSEVPELPPPTEAFPWIRYVRNEENVHFRRGVNQGAALAGGRYLLILNPDTYLTDATSIGRLAEILDQDEQAGLVGPMMRGDDGLLAPQGERLAGLAYLISAKSYLNVVWPGNPIARRQRRPGVSREHSARVDTLSAAALLCRCEQFLAVGGFDERATAYWEEHELARRLRAHGLHAYYRADAFVFHHWRQGGTQHESRAASERYFEQAMRLYYGEFYGRGGIVLFDALDGAQRLLRRARKLLGR